MKSSVASPAARAKEVLSKFNVRQAPVPVEELARQWGALVRVTPLDEELSGMVFVKDGVAIIGVNSLHHPNRQRFTIAHELGHLVMHKDWLTHEVHVDTKFRVLMRDGRSSTGVDLKEKEANQFAAELLIPTALLLPLLERGLEVDEEGVSAELARKFKVSQIMVEYRLANLDARPR